MLSKDNSQLTFDAVPFLKVVYDPEHPLMRLEKAIHWDALLEALSAHYSEDEGRPTISLRAKVGTLILKFVKNLSDRKIVKDVEAGGAGLPRDRSDTPNLDNLAKDWLARRMKFTPRHFTITTAWDFCLRARRRKITGCGSNPTNAKSLAKARR